MTNLKPLFDQIREKLSNTSVEEFRTQVSQGLNLGRQIVEHTAKDMYQQSKNSKLVNDYVIPLLESDQTEKALGVVSDKLNLNDTPLMKKVLEIRQDLIDTKIGKARTAEKADTPDAPSEK